MMMAATRLLGSVLVLVLVLGSVLVLVLVLGSVCALVLVLGSVCALVASATCPSLPAAVGAFLHLGESDPSHSALQNLPKPFCFGASLTFCKCIFHL